MLTYPQRRHLQGAFTPWRDVHQQLLGVRATTVNDAGVAAGGALGTAKIQSINISTDFGREDIYELGKRAPYYRAPNFPIEVTIDIEMIALGTDGINAAEEQENLTEQTIKIITEDGKTFDLGTKNRLSSVTYGGGDASGGQATCTYSYTNFNDLTITG